MRVSLETAEITAIQALAYIAGRESELSIFLDQTGVLPGELRSRAGDADVLAGVLDFLLANEQILIDFCADADIDPETILFARHQFPGAVEM